MKDSIVDLLIANFFIGLSFLVEGFAKIVLIILSLVLFISWIILARLELKSKFKLESLKGEIEEKRFRLLMNSINTLIEI